MESAADEIDRDCRNNPDPGGLADWLRERAAAIPPLDPPPPLTAAMRGAADVAERTGDVRMALALRRRADEWDADDAAVPATGVRGDLRLALIRDVDVCMGAHMVIEADHWTMSPHDYRLCHTDEATITIDRVRALCDDAQHGTVGAYRKAPHLLDPVVVRAALDGPGE